MGVRTKFSELTRFAPDTPWTIPMSDRTPTSRSRTTFDNGPRDNSVPDLTVAAFSPGQQTAAALGHNAVLIHQKSPLLTATPPQITRALAYSHPFILPLNALAGLITWTTGDPWESFLFVVAFWFATLYIDSLLRWCFPLLTIAVLVGAMHSRKYSPLVAGNWSKLTTAEKSRVRADSVTTPSTPATAQNSAGAAGTAIAADPEPPRKSLDEILETLRVFANRCDVFIDPFVQIIDFLGVQKSATTEDKPNRPALTSLFLRLLALTPVWAFFGGMLPPHYRLITTSRVILVLGTVVFTWHSVPARAARTILWRSHAVRTVAAFATGLHFPGVDDSPAAAPGLSYRTHDALQRALRARGPSDVRFTFAVYENQRRWVALGFSSNLFPSERAPWTEEHGNPCPDIHHFTLPDAGAPGLTWRWVVGSDWRVDPAWAAATGTEGGSDGEGWKYYDNKWKNGSKIDDWSKWTRRRRWIRDAVLVEISTPPATSAATGHAASPSNTTSSSLDKDKTTYSGFPPPPPIPQDERISEEAYYDQLWAAEREMLRREASDAASLAPSLSKRKAWFARRKSEKEAKEAAKEAAKEQQAALAAAAKEKKSFDSSVGVGGAGSTARDEDVHPALRYRDVNVDRSIGEGVAEGLS